MHASGRLVEYLDHAAAEIEKLLILGQGHRCVSIWRNVFNGVSSSGPSERPSTAITRAHLQEVPATLHPRAHPLLTAQAGCFCESTLDALDHDRHPADRLARELGLLDATMLVVASIIGAGIFLTPGTVADVLPHPGLVLAAWTVGGLLSLAGALANAELAGMFPHAGGDYVYLREAYHPLAGFLVGWLSFFVIYAGTVATLAVGFAEELVHFVPLGAAGALAVATATIVVTSAINYSGVRAGARVNNAATAVKVGALVAIAVAGLASGNGSLGHFRPLLAGAGDVPASQL